MYSRNLIKIRTKRGLTQGELSERSAVPQQVISSYETGTRKPKIEYLVALAKALNCSVYEIDKDTALAPVPSELIPAVSRWHELSFKKKGIILAAIRKATEE
ncbi:MAG: helix-turn-helix transcriptional regulator [Candidatus Hydrogenedentales bacterium]|jgi:transcriptional regulator with XRE-family HTH domain